SLQPPARSSPRASRSLRAAAAGARACIADRGPRMTQAKQQAQGGQQRLELDEAAIKAAATQHLDDGAVTPSYGPWREDIVRLLNDALATELVCVLRYKRHHFTATGLSSPAIADELMVHAQQEAAHGDKIAARIVELGGEPDFAPDK